MEPSELLFEQLEFKHPPAVIGACDVYVIRSLFSSSSLLGADDLWLQHCGAIERLGAL